MKKILTISGLFMALILAAGFASVNAYVPEETDSTIVSTPESFGTFLNRQLQPNQDGNESDGGTLPQDLDLTPIDGTGSGMGMGMGMGAPMGGGRGMSGRPDASCSCGTNGQNRPLPPEFQSEGTGTDTSLGFGRETNGQNRPLPPEFQSEGDGSLEGLSDGSASSCDCGMGGGSFGRRGGRSGRFGVGAGSGETNGTTPFGNAPFGSESDGTGFGFGRGSRGGSETLTVPELPVNPFGEGEAPTRPERPGRQTETPQTEPTVEPSVGL